MRIYLPLIIVLAGCGADGPSPIGPSNVPSSTVQTTASSQTATATRSRSQRSIVTVDLSRIVWKRNAPPLCQHT